MREDVFRNIFDEPTSEYKPAPLWVWNDNMEPNNIRFQLQQMADKGFGGAFVHPRPGLITPYLSEEWFTLWGIALEEAERLGLKLYIYDENSYPSGFAGGHVSAELPDCLANCVIFKMYNEEDLLKLVQAASPMLNRPGQPIRVFAMRRMSDRWELAKDLTMLPVLEWAEHGESFWVFELGTPETNSWLGGFAYTDLLRPEVTDYFLKTTHEQYLNRFGESFGTTIPALFTDEPEISPGNLFQEGIDFLPFSYWFAAEFTKRNGYDLLDYLPFLFRDVRSTSMERDAEQVRYDFYSTIHQLWIDNSVRPISEWCERNGIAYTGHYLEHNWPHPFNRSSPALMSLYEYMHWPAIDMLMTYMFRDNTMAWQTNHLMIGIREAHSVANQFDRPRVLCEAFGAGGWDATFEDFKRIGDWLYANGINFLNPHLTYATIVGARKRDHPQSFDWRQPWWNELSSFNDYFSRLSYVLSQGKTYNRILLLNPTTSSLLFTPQDLEENESYNLGVNQTRELAQRLCDAGWDYDWGDEYIIARHGSNAEAKIRVGNRKYDVVIVPPAMINMKSETVELLRRFMDDGGQVIAWNDCLERRDGHSWQAFELTNVVSWSNVDSYEQVDLVLRETLHPRTKWQSGLLERVGVTQLRRELEDGSTVYFIVNSLAEGFKDELHVSGCYGEIWDPLTGLVTPLPQADSEQISIPVILAGSGSLLVRIYSDRNRTAVTTMNSENLSESIVATNIRKVRNRMVTERSIVTPEQANIFPISYCDLQLGSKTYSGLYTLQASQLVYEYHGFPANPWDNAVQYKRRLLDRESSFDDKTGFIVHYRFDLACEDIPAEIGLMVERPELYSVYVNGIVVDLQLGSSWLDHHMGEGSIREVICKGENVISLEAKPFSIFAEIETIYLTGDFLVTEQAGKWVITKQKGQCIVGSWLEQGYPFYGSAFTYKKRVAIPEKVNDVWITLPDWSGTIATVQVNGNTAGMIGFDCGERLEITKYVLPGEIVEIIVRVAGSFKNLMGPHFDPLKPRNVAWPGNWKNAPIFGPPPAKAFDLIDYGLFTDFDVEISSYLE